MDETLHCTAWDERAAACEVDTRRHARVPYYLQVNIYGAERFCRALVRNLSLGGLYVECYDLLDADDRVCVDLELPGGRISVGARIAWVGDPTNEDPPGMGLEFVNPSPAVLALLRGAIRVAVRDPGA